ncbi:hypothetical protein D3C80_1739260 [compost metagenome]
MLGLAELIAKPLQYPLLDTRHNRTKAFSAQLLETLFIQIGLQHRLGKQPHWFHRMHDIQAGIESTSQGQGMLQDIGSIKTKVGSIENRANHAAS